MPDVSRITEAVYEWWGKRCLEFDSECGTCQAWAEVDWLLRAIERARFLGGS